MNKPIGVVDADIIFVNAPHFTPVYLNIGIAYLCEAVKAGGFAPAVIDANIDIIDKYRDYDISRFWSGGKTGRDQAKWWTGEEFNQVRELFDEDFHLIAETIASSHAQIVGFSVNYLNTKATELIATRVRAINPDKIILYGGHSCYHLDVCRKLSTVPDYIFVGESEMSIVEFLDAKFGGYNGRLRIEGVLDNKDPSNTFNPRRRQEDLDQFSWPRWQEYNLNKYKVLNDTITLNINDSRGCSWGKCKFCTDCVTSPGYRRRSNQSMFDEIRHHVTEYGIHCFQFTGLLFNGDHRRLETFADMLIASDLTIYYSAQFRLDIRLSIGLLKKLHASGMRSINFGVETGSDTMMRLMCKGTTVRMAERCLKNAKDADLVTNINILVGFPGETPAMISETISFLETHRDLIDIVEVVNICSVQYGAALWEHPGIYQIRFCFQPGEKEDSHWVSLDGASTYETRKAVAKRVVAKIEQLGIAQGYVSQPLVFMPSVTDHERFYPKMYQASVKELLGRIYQQHAFAQLLVLRSCPINMFEAFIRTVIQFDNTLTIDVLGQQGVASRLQNIPGIAHLSLYPGGALSTENVPAAGYRRIYTKRYDLLLIPIGFMPHAAYGHVFELAGQIDTQESVTVTPYGTIHA